MKHSRLAVVLVMSLLLAIGASTPVEDYHFGSAKFTNEFWINNKGAFTKPVGVDVEFLTSGAFDWVFADARGKEIRTLRARNEHGGWTGMNFASLGLVGDYSIGFRNVSQQRATNKTGRRAS